MGEIRFQQIRRIHGGVEPLAPRDLRDGGDWVGGDDKSLVRHRRKRRLDARNRWFVSMVSVLLVIAMVAVSIRGLVVGKWVHNAGGMIMLVTYAALIVLPFVSLARGDLKEYHPLNLVAPTWEFWINIFSKLAVGALAGLSSLPFWPGKRGTGAQHRTFRSRRRADHRADVHPWNQLGPRLLDRPEQDRSDRSGAADIEHRFQIVRYGWRPCFRGDLLLAARAIAVMSIYFTGTSRLPMVAGWDHLLPSWFSSLAQNAGKRR